MIFVDTNVISETLRKTPNPAVIAWLKPGRAFRAAVLDFRKIIC